MPAPFTTSGDDRPHRGKRLRSTVSETEVIVIRAPNSAVELCCGGHPMTAEDVSPTAAAAASGAADDATLLGKRYVDEASGLEVLCAKSGTGALVADGRQLAIKAPKALPASDSGSAMNVMNVLTLLEMAATGMPDRVAVGRTRTPELRSTALTYSALLDRARAGAATLRDLGADELVYLGVNIDDFPTALFAAAWAGIPLVPVNYRLSHDSLATLLAHHRDALVVSDLQPPTGAHVLSIAQWRTACARPAGDMPLWTADPDAVALLLYTSGTTSEPKAAVLRHQHLASYLLSSVDFGAADEHEAALVSVPPYDIAGVSNLLSNVYAGRRVVYLQNFTPEGWLDCVRTEQISHALLVPTMIARIAEHLGDGATADVPTLRSLAYGGSKMPVPVLERAIRLFPTTDFVNAYGLTETSSTIAVLGPEDHRAALDEDELARARLGSAGRLIPGIEVQIRGPRGAVRAGVAGDIFVRGPQVSGEYRDQGTVLDDDGWFATRDRPLHPLVGGLPPKIGWRYLHSVVDEVMPALDGAGAAG